MSEQNIRVENNGVEEVSTRALTMDERLAFLKDQIAKEAVDEFSRDCVVLKRTSDATSSYDWLMFTASLSCNISRYRCADLREDGKNVKIWNEHSFEPNEDVCTVNICSSLPDTILDAFEKGVKYCENRKNNSAKDEPEEVADSYEEFNTLDFLLTKWKAMFYGSLFVNIVWLACIIYLVTRS